MKIVSHHASHADQVAQQGHAVINGITFTAGIDGKPTATVAEHQIKPFSGAAKFSLYSDDGQYSGPLKDERLETARPILGPTGQVVSVVMQNQQTSFNTQLDQLVKGPNVPPVAPEPQESGTGNESAEQSANTETEQTTQKTAEAGAAGDSQEGGEELDVTDPAALGTVSRTELISVADHFGVAHSKIESNDLIPEIVKAAKAAKAKAARAVREAKANGAKTQPAPTKK